MIEIRTFAGDAEELAQFVNRVWRQSYAGRMLVPLWSAEFLRRDLFPEDHSARDFIVAAYDGAKLIGVHPVKPVNIRVHAEELPATWGSFLSVDPEYRRQGVAQQMRQQSVQRHRERGAVVNLGYLYLRSTGSLGPKFWLRQPEGTMKVCNLGMWVRAFDHTAVARFELYKIEAWGSRAFSLLQRAPRPPANGEGIRRYRPDDLAACMQLICQAGQAVSLAYLWDPASLGRQLQFGNLSDTIVLESEGHVAGLVNYTLLEVFGKCAMSVAVIDLLALGSLRPAERRRLLAAAMCEMVARGAQGAMMLRGSWYAGQTMLAAGFFPVYPEYCYVGTRMQEGFHLQDIGSVQVLWR
jgi:GNAT superfamily N-acetyltransferase